MSSSTCEIAGNKSITQAAGFAVPALNCKLTSYLSNQFLSSELQRTVVSVAKLVVPIFSSRRERFVMYNSKQVSNTYLKQAVSKRQCCSARNNKQKECKIMASPFDPRINDNPSTYVVQDRKNKKELTRLTVQDRVLTASIGGVLPEQANPTLFCHVLDIGCGTGGWCIQAAQTYTAMSLVGIDISQRMIELCTCSS